MNQYLEQLLQEKASQATAFPGGRTDYYSVYEAIKAAIYRDARFVNCRLSFNDDFIPTDHGKEHTESVIRAAGMLLKPSVGHGQPHELNPYETFILLVSILLHDAGNLFGRVGHEQHCLGVLLEVAGGCLNSVEAANIARIASAHGGKTEIGGVPSKDTIGLIIRKDLDGYLSIQFRPQLLASITRFADEICEDSSRTSKFLIDSGLINPESEIFHKYGACISNVTFDPPDRSIRITFQIEKDWLLNKMPKQTSAGLVEIYLIDEIFNRLNKMNCERHYCARFFGDVLKVKSIKAELEIFHDDRTNRKFTELDRTTLSLSDSGYPSIPDVQCGIGWSGEVLAAKFREVSA